jgi:hypothetical protein
MSIRKINIFDKIGALIPGYSGYAERDSRKNCDKKLRIFLSERLKKFEDLINEKILDTINESKIENLAHLEILRKKTSNLSSKIGFAPYGSNAFFSDQKIDSNELDVIYNYDLEISEKIETLFLDDTINYNEAINIISSVEDILMSRNNFIKKLK